MEKDSVEPAANAALKKEGPTLRRLIASFHYLDVLRESGVTNMFGAAPYLQHDLGRSRDDAVTDLRMWMQSFSEEPVERRAQAAISKATSGSSAAGAAPTPLSE